MIDPAMIDPTMIDPAMISDEAPSAFATIPPLAPMSAETYRRLFNKWLDLQTQVLFEQMTDHQRVGQLLMVTFEGDHKQLDADDVLSELETFIHEYHIGGFAISAYHDNFYNVSEENTTADDLAQDVSTPLQVAILNTKLQAAAYGWNLSEKQARAIISGAAPLTQTLKTARPFPVLNKAIQDDAVDDADSQDTAMACPTIMVKARPMPYYRVDLPNNPVN